MAVALHLFLYCTVCTVYKENLFLSLDPFSGESEAQSQQAIGPAIIGVLPAVQLIKGKRAWEGICFYMWENLTGMPYQLL